MFVTQEEKSGTATPESTGVDATPDTDKKEETYQVKGNFNSEKIRGSQIDVYTPACFIII